MPTPISDPSRAAVMIICHYPVAEVVGRVRPGQAPPHPQAVPREQGDQRGGAGPSAAPTVRAPTEGGKRGCRLQWLSQQRQVTGGLRGAGRRGSRGDVEVLTEHLADGGALGQSSSGPVCASGSVEIISTMLRLSSRLFSATLL